MLPISIYKELIIKKRVISYRINGIKGTEGYILDIYINNKLFISKKAKNEEILLTMLNNLEEQLINAKII